MKKLVILFLHILAISLLTVLTQIGGLAYIFYLLIKKTVVKKLNTNISRRFVNFFLFAIIYSIFSFAIVPFLAKNQGRVPLPAFANKSMPIKPVNLLTVIANRHYVCPELKNVIEKTSKKMQQTHPDFHLLYLDANFPFFNGFPLLPHLSHDDGKKLDLAFIYKDIKTSKPKFGKSPSWLGYGVCEKPLNNEYNQPAACAGKGNWQYSILQDLTPQLRKKRLVLAENITADLIKELTKSSSTSKIFIEPHLKKRLGLNNDPKIRFHGCHAVRHDDHIHVEVR